MESHAPVSLYIQQNSKKRVFPGGSSSSSGCKDVEVLEIPPPPNNLTSKPISSRHKEVMFPEIIDVDMEEDCNDVMLTDAKVETGAKGKEALLYPSVGHSSLENHEANNLVARLHDSIGTVDFSTDLFCGEDEWIDTYYDDILFDEYAVLESHFDHMDIPPGVEAPFPWLPTSSTNDVNLPASNTSTNLIPALNSDSWPPLTQDLIEDLSVSSNNSMEGLPMNAGSQNMKGKSVTSSSQPPKVPLGRKYGKGLSYPFGKSKRKSRGSHITYSNHYNQIPAYSSKINSGNVYMASDMMMNKPGLGTSSTLWQEMALNMSEPSFGPSGVMNGSTFSSWAQEPAISLNAPSSIDTLWPTTVKQRNVDEILQSFDLFKNFDTVEDYSDHHYSKNGSSTKQPPKNWAKRIQDEWKILEKDLPDKIFVRVYESRMDLLRAVIVGAEGTPYHDGLFFFDVFFPSSYPNVPPHVHYHSGGLRINPNLYHCGKVCLSLLNTWSGSQKEKWIPGVSTMLQVLVSIQGLILNANPFFNEPGYANMNGSVGGEKRSLEYNERTFIHSLQTMVYNMRRPPKYFEDFVIGHFCKHARDILVSCKAYLEGAQVGCLVKGGVQDVDEGDKSCSLNFKHNLAQFITLLVNTFSEIGAKDCQEFLSLAQKGNEVAPAASHRGRPKLHQLSY